jgi:hypothetical protein
MRLLLNSAAIRSSVLAGVLFVLATSPAEGSALPRLPTELVGRQALEVRPPVVDFTGDGTGVLGGFTGHESIPYRPHRNERWIGHLRWTLWNGLGGRATGAVWLNDGIPDDARGTFYPYAVTVHVFRPRAGIFTRLAFSYSIGDRLYATVRRAHFYPGDEYGPGYWAWF